MITSILESIALHLTQTNKNCIPVVLNVKLETSYTAESQCSRGQSEIFV